MENKQLTSYSEHYFEICKDNCLSYLKLKDEYADVWKKIEFFNEKYENEGDEEDLSEEERLINIAAGIRNKRDAAGHITIIFAAMCLEAVINHYAISRTSKNYFDNYLDRLDIKSKWIIIPELISNAKINTDSQAYELLVKLIKLRNDLVHYKSREIKFDDEYSENFTANIEIFHSQVRDSIKCVFSVVKELYKIDKGWKENLWYQLSIIKHPELKKYI